jgi:predicted membrane protein
MEFILKTSMMFVVFIPIAAVFPIWFYTIVFVIYVILDCCFESHMENRIANRWMDKAVREEVRNIIKEERSVRTTEVATQNSAVGEQHEAQGSGQ